MPLPAIPSTHRWIDGGAVVRFIGSAVTGSGKDATMFCWDRDTDLRVTDLYDQDGSPVTEVPVGDNTFYCAVPKTITKPVFSVGQSGARFAGNDWDALSTANTFALSEDAAVAALIGGPGTATRAAGDALYAPALVGGKAPVRKGDLVLNVKDYGAVGNGTTDDTTAIQAAINAAPAGATIFFPWTGSSAYFKITSGLNITTPNLRLRGDSRDGYGVSIRCATASVTMLTVKAPSLIIDDLGFLGDSAATNGVGATVTGLDLFGDINANVDAWLRRATFQGMARAINQRGRNVTVESCTISNCLAGVRLNGIDATYHTGPSAESNRGNWIKGTRFHNIGGASTDAAVEITTTAKMQHAMVTDNFFDSGGLGRHIVAAGTSTDPCKRLTVRGNKHTETAADVVVFDWVQNSVVTDMHAASDTGISGQYGRGVVLTNSTDVLVEARLLQMGQTGFYGRSNTRVTIAASSYRAGGIDPATTGHGIDFDSTNTDCRFESIKVDNTDGWGFIGEPTSSTMHDCDFTACTLGRVNSKTLMNLASSGRNRFAENAWGRIEDIGMNGYTFVAGTAQQVASIIGGGSFSSFLFEVTYTTRDGTGDCYVSNRYAVRTENGTPVVTLLGTAAAARMTVTTAASGTSGITVSLTSTAASWGVVTIRAWAPGAANATNPRSVTVTMT